MFEVEDEGWWNADEDVYTWPIRMGGWGARIECHGNTPEDAKSLATLTVQAFEFMMSLEEKK